MLFCSAGYIAYLNGGSLDLSDTEVRIVVSGSMDGEPRDYGISTIPTGSMVFIEKVSGDGFYRSLDVGDVLTFHYSHPVSREDMVVTHRIVAISEDAGRYTYTLTGDSMADDPTNSSVQTVTSDSGDIIGKVVGVSPVLGKVAVFLSSWTGKVCLILVPCAILVASETRNILRILREGKDGTAEVRGPGSIPEHDGPAAVDPDTDPGNGNGSFSASMSGRE